MFSASDIPRTEIEVRAKSVAFMGEIRVRRLLQEARARPRPDELVEHHPRSLKTLEPIACSTPNFAHPGVIKSIERGEAADSRFWNSARLNHFKNEAAWQSLINARPILPPEGAKVIK